jgi:hypothetical protein
MKSAISKKVHKTTWNKLKMMNRRKKETYANTRPAQKQNDLLRCTSEIIEKSPHDSEVHEI